MYGALRENALLGIRMESADVPYVEPIEPSPRASSRSNDRGRSGRRTGIAVDVVNAEVLVDDNAQALIHRYRDLQRDQSCRHAKYPLPRVVSPAGYGKQSE